jgi:exopolyphosphatase/guanosine-5'-triphosphate,3'-diphosphate pyrophosphatase
MIACDLGSNTLRIVQLDCESGERIHEFERMVKTADKLYVNSRINEAAIARIINAIKEAQAEFDFYEDEVHAVATAAVRLAKNSQEVLRRIEEETGVHFICIDAVVEAKLTHLAVKWRLGKLGYHDSFMLLDLGGASTEITIGAKSKSFNIGIVTMAQKYEKDGVVSHLDGELSMVRTYITSLYQEVKKPRYFVATAGTPTTIAAFMQGLDYAHYDVEKVNGTKLDIDDLDKALQQLLSFSIKEREKWVGVGRDALIIAGIEMVKYIMISAGFNEMIVIDDGLREGVALQKCQEKATFSAHINLK